MSLHESLYMKTLTIAILGVLIIVGFAEGQQSAAHAEPCGPHITVDFMESSPDFIDIANRSAPGWALVSLTIDLGGSRGRLFFDTDAAGEGVSMYQPFAGDAGRAGAVHLERLVGPSDGGQVVTLEFSRFDPGRDFSFEIDIDDRLENSMLGQTHVDGSELAGARIAATMRGPTGSITSNASQFRDDNHATIGGGGCV